MASCLTFQTHYAFANATTTAKTAYSMPILTATTTPQSCALVVITGAEYQTQQTSITTANNNAVTANNTANGVNQIATDAQTIANNAMAQTNALANITQGLNTFNNIFNIPDNTSLGAAWSAGFVLPMTIGLVSYAVAKLVNFWDER